jgi:hypothetical protein
MPEPVNKVVGSSRGTRFDLAIFEWPRAAKKARYSWRRSAACMLPSYMGLFRSLPQFRGPGTRSCLRSRWGQTKAQPVPDSEHSSGNASPFRRGSLRQVATNGCYQMAADGLPSEGALRSSRARLLRTRLG